jgi:nicotinate-nucleotide adenylyltransferase
MKASGAKMVRVGIFAGAFDPVHRGHIAFALAAAARCQLDKVVLLPERSPRGKLGVSDFKHRLRMARLAVRPHRKLTVLALDDTQFTTDATLPQLSQRYPGAELVLLIGSDVARSFGFRWPGLERLLCAVELAISLRAGESAEDLQEFLGELKLPVRAMFINGPHASVSASEVRQGNLQVIEPLVRGYIEQNGLYRPQVA